MAPVTSSFVPWRPAPSRVAAFEFVLDWYARHLPEFAVRTIDTDDDVFVLAACRNRAVATADPDEVVVVGDADTLPEPDALREAVSAARDERSGAPAVHGVSLAGCDRRCAAALGYGSRRSATTTS